MGARRFSIITVSYNAAGAIGRTARSVIGQKFRDFEYLVVDGASSDGTPQEALEATKGSNDIDVNIVSEPDNGLYDAMNKGIDRATGDYLIFLNAGDTFHSSDTLSILNKAIEDNDFPGIVYGQTDIVDSTGQRLADRHLKAPDQLPLASSPTPRADDTRQFLSRYARVPSGICRSFQDSIAV